MKKRIISSAIIVLVTALFIIYSNKILDSLIVFALSLAGIYEYNKAFKSAGYRPISFIGYVACSATFLVGESVPEETKMMILKCILPILLIGSFVYIILIKLKRNIVDVAITIFSLLYIPFMFSFIKLILFLEGGRFFLAYVIVVAFVGDAFAYMVGRTIGKHKLCPEISPNKTVEGSLGSIVGVTLAGVIMTTIGNFYLGMSLNIWSMLLAGFVAGVAGQFGDLAASAIKRFCNVKDFGNLIPGHGGILDRFDSILFIAPIMYIFLKLYM
ncbi:MAG: phosphatidate cytidylyltransferase [Clostridia bacterium]|nr:phosphatidate cytidylyltransferase [Clostridia bacterium]